MPLTTAQLQALKADIAANTATVLINGVATPISAVPVSPDNAAQVAGWYNLTAAPDYWLWRAAVSQLEIVSLKTPAPDNTVWSWPAFIARTQGERDGWREMFADTGYIDFFRDNIRQGLADIFSGTANNAPAQRAHLLRLGRAQATNAGKLLAVAVTVAGNGNTLTDARGSTTNPDAPGYFADLTGQDILNAWAS